MREGTRGREQTKSTRRPVEQAPSWNQSDPLYWAVVHLGRAPRWELSARGAGRVVAWAGQPISGGGESALGQSTRVAGHGRPERGGWRNNPRFGTVWCGFGTAVVRLWYRSLLCICMLCMLCMLWDAEDTLVRDGWDGLLWPALGCWGDFGTAWYALGH